MSDRKQILIVILITVFIIPLLLDVYYIVLYFVVALLFLPIGIYLIVHREKYEQMFMKRWEQDRVKGFGWNFLKNSIYYFIYLTVFLLISRLFGFGLTPVDFVTGLSNDQFIRLLTALIVFSIIGGIGSWFEKKYRYRKLLERSKDPIQEIDPPKTHL